MLKHVHGYFYEPFGGNQTIGIFDMRYTEIWYRECRQQKNEAIKGDKQRTWDDVKTYDMGK